MLSDIEIAQGCQMRPITEVAAAAGLDADDLELYGKYKAKLSADVWTKVKDKENGKVAVDYDFCKGCGVCASVCHPDVIHMEAEK